MFPFICSESIHEDPETSGKVSQTSRDLTADLSGQYSNPLSGERYTLRPSGLDYTIFTNYFKLWVRLSTAKNPFSILHNALSTLCQCRSSFPKRKWGICSYHTNKCDISILQQPELHTCITILSRVSNSSSKFMIMRTIHSALHHSPFSEELSDSTRTMRWSGKWTCLEWVVLVRAGVALEVSTMVQVGTDTAEVVSKWADFRRSTDTLSFRPLKLRVKYLSALSSTRNGPSYGCCIGLHKYVCSYWDLYWCKCSAVTALEQLWVPALLALTLLPVWLSPLH